MMYAVVVNTICVEVEVISSQVDLFLQCEDNDGITKLQAVYEACQSVAKSLPQSGGHKNMLITKTSCTVTFFISNDKQIPPVQVHVHGSIGNLPHPYILAYTSSQVSHVNRR